MTIIVVAFACGVGARAARAVDASQVEDLIRQGLDLRHAGQDGRALPFFRKAYEAERTARTAGQLGLCELALGYWVDVETHLGEATASVGNPWVEKNRRSLETSRARAHENVGSVAVTGGPVGAKVFLDQHEVSALPLDRPLRLSKGPHDVELRAPGFVTMSKSVTVRGLDQQAVTLVLSAVPAPASVVAVRPAPPPQASDPSVPTATDQPAASQPRRTLAWVAGGAAAVAIAVGVAATVVWVGDRKQFDDHLGPPVAGSTQSTKNCGSDDPSYGGPGCQGIHEDLTLASAFALVGYGVGAALAVGAIILFETPPAAEPKTSSALSCAPDLLGKGLSCRMSF